MTTNDCPEHALRIAKSVCPEDAKSLERILQRPSHRQSARRNGYLAARRGDPPWANPHGDGWICHYVHGMSSWEEWDRGYTEALRPRMLR